jgi:hypothetical protein
MWPWVVHGVCYVPWTLELTSTSFPLGMVICFSFTYSIRKMPRNEMKIEKNKEVIEVTSQRASFIAWGHVYIIWEAVVLRRCLSWFRWISLFVLFCSGVIGISVLLPFLLWHRIPFLLPEVFREKRARLLEYNQETQSQRIRTKNFHLMCPSSCAYAWIYMRYMRYNSI